VWRIVPDRNSHQSLGGLDHQSTLYYTYHILEIGSFPLSDQVIELYWDSTYAIATALIEQHPDCDPEAVGLEEMALMIENLVGFEDDPSQVTEQLLLDIQTVWYEEALNL
jgi:FeS assembly protein IscX